MKKIKELIKKFTPESVILFYHKALAFVSAVFYKYPSKEMIVIGITGTKGKTSASHYIKSVLEKDDKVGLISTSEICIGPHCHVNEMHMTMPGRFFLQSKMREMANAGCKYCIVETTSQGILLHRHRYIEYDVAIFTNLTPEHIDAHGSFNAYKRCKGELFKQLSKFEKKQLQGDEIQKIAIANIDDKNGEYYFSFPADKYTSYSIDKNSKYQARDLQREDVGYTFNLHNTKYNLNIFGKFNVYNAIPGIICGEIFKLKKEQIQKGISNIHTLKGRIEEVEGDKPFRIFIDYAHEGNSLKKVLQEGRELTKNKLIVLTGSEGGGRDIAKRAILGSTAIEYADMVVFSSTDPYDEDPYQILKEMADSATKVGGVLDKNIFIKPDRREGIAKAISLAGEGDVVIIAGKGSETFMWKAGKKIPFNDRKTIIELLYPSQNK